MKPLLIAHAEDPDGILSRVLAMRYFYMRERKPEEHIFIRYDRIVEGFQEAVKRAHHHKFIYVADVSINQRLIQAGGSDFALLEKLARQAEVYWFDHHPESLRHKNMLAQLGINADHDENQCAALLLQRHFQIKDSYGLKLAKIAQAHDHKNDSSDAENIRIGNELEKIIALANEGLNYDLLLDLTCDLRDEKCFDGEFKVRPSWQFYVDQFNQREGQAYGELDNTVEVVKLGKYHVLFGYSSPLLSQKPGPSYLRKQYGDKADVFFCLFRPPVRNHIILTSGTSSFPVVSFVQGLGGDGRESPPGSGGGFTLDYNLTPDNYQQIKEMLLSRMEKYAQKSSA